MQLIRFGNQKNSHRLQGGQMAIMESKVVRDKTIILNNDKGQKFPPLAGGADGNYGIQNCSR
jgi:hypothetical protein